MNDTFVPFDKLVDEIDKPKASGRPADKLVYKVSRQCYWVNVDFEKIVRFRCLGNGCRMTWAAPRNKTRVLKHAGQCENIAPALRREVNHCLGNASLSSKIEEDEVVIAQAQQSESSPRASTSLSSSKEIIFTKIGREQQARKISLTVVNLICGAGLAVSIAKYDEWKAFFQVVAPYYTPMSSSTIEDQHIPAEAARIRNIQIDELKKLYNLTVSFDGGSTRFPQSVELIHITTPEREVYFVEGHEASDKSHTAEFIRDIILDVSSNSMSFKYLFICFAGVGADWSRPFLGHFI